MNVCGVIKTQPEAFPILCFPSCYRVTLGTTHSSSHYGLKQGSPTPRPVRNQATQQEVSLNVKGLNYPETIPPTWVHGKIVVHEIGPWCQKGWGPLTYSIGKTLGQRKNLMYQFKI